MSMTGAFVLPEMMVGIVDASTTRSPATRYTRQSVSSTVAPNAAARGVKGSHRAGTHRMENSRTEFTGRLLQLFIARQLRTG